jgi:TRAP transporter TAXI family solute receptor
MYFPLNYSDLTLLAPYAVCGLIAGLWALLELFIEHRKLMAGLWCNKGVVYLFVLNFFVAAFVYKIVSDYVLNPFLVGTPGQPHWIGILIVGVMFPNILRSQLTIKKPVTKGEGRPTSISEIAIKIDEKYVALRNILLEDVDVAVAEVRLKIAEAVGKKHTGDQLVEEINKRIISLPEARQQHFQQQLSQLDKYKSTEPDNYSRRLVFLLSEVTPHKSFKQFVAECYDNPPVVTGRGKRRLAIWATLITIIAAAGLLSGVLVPRYWHPHPPVSLKLYSGREGGCYYPLGNALEQVLNAHFQENGTRWLSIHNDTNTPGASANLRHLVQGDGQLALIQDGLPAFSTSQEHTDVFVLGRLYSSSLHVVVQRSLGLKSLQDIGAASGKHPTVFLGLKDSGTRVVAETLLKRYQISLSSLKVVEMNSFKEAAEGMNSGSIQVGFFMMGLESEAMRLVADNPHLDLMDLSDETIKGATDALKYLKLNQINRGAYNKDFPSRTITTVKMDELLVCSKSVDMESAKEIVKALSKCEAPLLQKFSPFSLERERQHYFYNLHPAAETLLPLPTNRSTP